MELNQISARVFEIRNFLSTEECADLIIKSEAQGYEEAKVNMGGTQVMEKSIRNNDRLFWDNVPFAEKLWEKLKPFVPESYGGMKAIGLNERFRFYRYYPGQQFRGHIDGPFRRNLNERSFFTFMIYLNDDYRGGGTVFNEFRIPPETGKALVFAHSCYHAGEMQESGAKYVLRTDIMYRREPAQKTTEE